jgi:hypothetical protein
MLHINTEMADLRARLQALQAQAHEAEQRWRRAEAAAAAAESRLSESSLAHDSAYQSALTQIRDAKDALMCRFDHQQQRIHDMCFRLRSSLSSLPMESLETISGSQDGIEQLENLLGKVENVFLHVTASDAAATPAPVLARPHATPLMGGIGASTIKSAASTAPRFTSPSPHKVNNFATGGGDQQSAHHVDGKVADEASRWLELQLTMCRQEFAAMESRFRFASRHLLTLMPFVSDINMPWIRPQAGAQNECAGPRSCRIMSQHSDSLMFRRSCSDALRH